MFTSTLNTIADEKVHTIKAYKAFTCDSTLAPKLDPGIIRMKNSLDSIADGQNMFQEFRNYEFIVNHY